MKIYKYCTALFLLLSAMAANAQNLTLNVTGTVSANTCTASLTGQQTVALGTASTSSFTGKDSIALQRLVKIDFTNCSNTTAGAAVNVSFDDSPNKTTTSGYKNTASSGAATGVEARIYNYSDGSLLDVNTTKVITSLIDLPSKKATLNFIVGLAQNTATAPTAGQFNTAINATTSYP